MFGDCKWPYWAGRGPFESGVRPSLEELKEIMKRLSEQPSTGSDSKLVPPVHDPTVPNTAFLVSSNGQWRKRVIGISPVTIKYLHFLCCHPANYFLLLYYYPATICNFCDNTRKLFTTFVIIPDIYLQLLWLYLAYIYNFCDSTRQLLTTSVIIPGNYLQLLWLYPATICNFSDSTRQLFATSVIAPGN
jgi:hypothetical protein